MPQITRLLELVQAGDRTALNQLIDQIYPELHRIAEAHLRRERPDHTLQPTALVHEAYLKLVRDPPAKFADRAHFLALTSKVMRRVLVEHARAHTAEKRGGGQKVQWSVDLDVEAGNAQERLDLLELEGALQALSVENAPLGELIEMKYFGGMTDEECAEVTGRSVHSIRYELRLARAWLRRELASKSG